MRKFFLFSMLFCCSLCVAQKDTFSFLALGDSYTASTGELSENGWPKQLTTYLNKKNIAFQDPIVVAGAGWTTTKLLEELKTADIKNNYDYVALMIGVNNQYRGLDFEIFKEEFSVLLEKSIGLANENASRVLVISIPDWSVTPFAKFKNHKKVVNELKRYNTFIKNESDSKKALFIDVTKLSQNMAVDRALIASDSLHPSKKMYRIWAKRIGKKLLKSL